MIISWHLLCHDCYHFCHGQNVVAVLSPLVDCSISSSPWVVIAISVVTAGWVLLYHVYCCQLHLLLVFPLVGLVFAVYWLLHLSPLFTMTVLCKKAMTVATLVAVGSCFCCLYCCHHWLVLLNLLPPVVIADFVVLHWFCWLIVASFVSVSLLCLYQISHLGNTISQSLLFWLIVAFIKCCWIAVLM